MLGWISSIAEGIKNLGSNIVSGITDTLVAIFVPSEDFLTARWNKIKQKFAFADGLSAVGDYVLALFDEASYIEPPKVYINFKLAESKYDYGGQAFCLDMSWYQRYKPTVDAWLSAWLWITFAWRVYVKLPNIINGVSGDFETVDNFSSRESLFNQGTKIRANREKKHSVNFRRNK